MTRPLKVVHLTLGLDVGGQEKLLVEFARHANRRQVDLHFISLTTRGALAGELESHGWPVTALEAPSGLRPGLILGLARVLRRLGADVLHTHDDRPNIHGAPAAHLAGVRRVIHTRHHQGTHLSRRQRWLVRFVSLFDHRFVCISHDSARHALAAGIGRRRVVVLPNGIDLERFAPTGPKPTGPAVLVARLAPVKDVGTLLDAVALLALTCPDFRLEIAGDGPCRAELEAQAVRLGLSDHVRFLGVVHDVPALLARARLFVLSSISEGISLTLLEAMARGLPVIATAVGGNPEVIEAGQTGLLVPAREPASLAAALARLWTEPESCARMGEEGRRRAERLFDVRRMVADYETLYRTC